MKAGDVGVLPAGTGHQCLSAADDFLVVGAYRHVRRALPAIFCASATLIEKHEICRKRKACLAGERRGQEAAALDAAGTALGAIGMLTFAIVFWLLVERSVAVAFVGASLAWLVVSVAAWFARRKMRSVRRAEQIRGPAMSRNR